MAHRARHAPGRHTSRRGAPAWTPDLPTLTPIALALLVALPMRTMAQAVTRPAVPLPTAVPVPAASWRVQGSGAAWAAPVANTRGGLDAVIDQSSQRAIYQWQSFDIGASSSVMFNLPTSGAALNRVVGSTSPSQIFGQLGSTVPGANGTRVPGGELLLINQNGILFGSSAQVNTGGLIASALNVGNDDFMGGLTASILGATPSFRYDADPGLFTDTTNFVRVDAGAAINTTEGGRVFLFGKNVQNAGSIATPGGQTVLAGGGEVYLQSPTAEALYASEINPQIPALRGLLVEVGGVAGAAVNLKDGVISTPRGNTTLVGMAVNQAGRVSATTSVSENGSIFLMARGGASATDSFGTTQKRAQIAGTLTLGPGSTTEITPDTQRNVDGSVRTSDGNSTFTTSRVELSGKTIELQSGATIVAHGGIVNARAEAIPNYEANAAQTGQFGAEDAQARLVIGADASIDVSGTTSASASVARNYVTTELLGKSDLKDAPLQQDGVLYRSRVTFDLRAPVAILGDTSSYQNGIKRSVDERLASGGSVTLASTGAVVTHQRSDLNVSGGSFTYTADLVSPTMLIGLDGSRSTLNSASPDALYTGIEGRSAVKLDRWGIVPQYVPAQATSGHLESGYVEGRSGGSLTVLAPVALLDGKLEAATIAGGRQTQAIDARAKGATLTLGSRISGVVGGGFGETGFRTAVLRDLDITASGPPQADPLWTDTLNAVLAADTRSRIAADTLNGSGVGVITVTTDGDIHQKAGADLQLTRQARVDLAAGGESGIALDGNFKAIGGSLSARTADRPNGASRGASESGSISVAAGRSIDVAGDWVNQFRDGQGGPVAVAAGSVSMSSARGLLLGDGSVIDVSGGATLTASGTLKATSAGSITLAGDVGINDIGTPAPIHIGASLRAGSFGGGGKLAIKANSVEIGSAPLVGGIADGAAPGSLLLAPEFFTQGAFESYDIAALRSLSVADGVTLHPQAHNWIATTGLRNVASGSRLADVASEGVLSDTKRKPASLSLTAKAPFAAPTGDLQIGNGARIELDPRGQLALAAGRTLDVEGTLRAAGGKVSLAVGGGSLEPTEPGRLRVGQNALIDVAGTTLLAPTTDGLLTGEVLAGGSVSLDVTGLAARGTPIEIAEGAVINADGASHVLDVASTDASGRVTVQRRIVGSAGGSIAVGVADGGATLAGDLHAIGGNATAAAGSFKLSINSGRRLSDPTPTDAIDAAVEVRQGEVHTADAAKGIALVSAGALRGGFADVSLQATDHIRFDGNVDLLVPRNLRLDAPAVELSPDAIVRIGGVTSTLLGGSTTTSDRTAAPALASGGTSQLRVAGGLVELFGHQVTQGVGRVEVRAGTELRLHGVDASGSGSFGSEADLVLSAPQVLPTSGSRFTIDAPGRSVTLRNGDSHAALPLSANGSVTINAANIVQDGVLRAPFGTLTLNGSESVTLTSRSVTSVSGAGLDLPYGSTLGGTNWNFNGTAMAAPAEKTVNLLAPGQRVDVQAGAKLDLSGGGEMLALEFVPGPGGSKDVFAGAASGAFAVVPASGPYAPQDNDLLNLADASGAKASIQFGRQVTFGPGGPIPAGTYAVLPARYAVLDGAYLVKPVKAGAPMNPGAALKRPDGTVLVGGVLGDAGTAYVDSLPSSFQVLSSAQARRYSEIRSSSADTYFAAQAKAANVVPPLPMDAGRLNVVADQLALKGSVDFSRATTGSAGTSARGGEVDIAATRILVTDAEQAGPADVLTLSNADLNALGAARVVLGGQTSATTGDGRVLSVTAQEVIVDNQGSSLRAGDLILAATDRVTLRSGSSLVGDPASDAPALRQVGDGALLRVGGDAAATSTRTGTVRQRGELSIEEGASIAGASVTAEATRSTAIAGGAKLSGNAVTIGASRIAVGDIPSEGVGPTTLELTPTLAAQLASADRLTLRSFDGIDLYGQAALGSDAQRSLVLDAASLRLVTPGATAVATAGDLRLTNTSGSSGAAQAGTGVLTLRATGANGGSGQVMFGPGSVSVAGAGTVVVDAASAVAFGGVGQLTVPGDLTLKAPALIATQAGRSSVTAGGTFRFESDGNAGAVSGQAGLGAHLAISAATIEQAGTIVLPSGELTLNGTGGSDGTTVRLAQGSLIDLSGRTFSFDGVKSSTRGGDLVVNAQSGDVVMQAGARIDVSAPSDGNQAGSLTIAATQGAVSLGGGLRATALRGGDAGSLSIDANAPVDLANLAGTINAPRTAALDNFGESISIRNRTGDQRVEAGTVLGARHVNLSSDAGALGVAGTIEATGVDSSIALAAGGDLNVAAGATLAAHGTGASGASISLGSTGGTITAAAGATLDTAGIAGGADGRILLRAGRTGMSDDAPGGSEVAVAAIGAQVVGAREVQVEAVKSYSAFEVESSLIEQINADNDAFAGPGGSGAAAMRNRIANGNADLLARLQLRAGVEVTSLSPGDDLYVSGDVATNGWNLARFSATGQPIAQPSGAPMNLTLRAGGNLYVMSSISDGFVARSGLSATASSASVIAPLAAIADGPAATIRLVGGADLSAADVLATVKSDTGGDVVIGADGTSVSVRTTTGDIQIASGRDTVLLNRAATVYTTGVPVARSELADFVGFDFSNANGKFIKPSALIGAPSQSPFLTGGGSVSVQASRDVVGGNDEPAQYGTEWLWRATDQRVDGAPLWWSRYDQFKQGFATFGGGSASVAAGRDASGVEVSTAGSGYVGRDATGATGQTHLFGGGDVSLSAGRNVIGGFVLSGNGQTAVRAGGSLVAPEGQVALQVLHGTGNIDIRARNDADIGAVASFGMAGATPEGPGFTPVDLLIGGVASGASLQAQAAAGDLVFRGVASVSSDFPPEQPHQLVDALQNGTLPDHTTLAAPSGSVSVGNVVQLPTQGSSLDVLAQANVSVAGITVVGSSGLAQPSSVANVGTLATAFGPGLNPFDTGTRDPVRVVAKEGDIGIASNIAADKPLRLLAGRDIVSTDVSNTGFIEIQHQGAAEVSLIEAGRDIVLPNNNAKNPDLKLHGPGDLIVIAGRDVNLRSSGGIATVGNRENSRLPEGSAGLTVLAGVGAGGASYTRASDWYFPVLGGAGIADHAGDLAAQIEAAKNGQPLPPSGSAAAAAFDALPVDAQIERVTALVGTRAFDISLLRAMQRRTGDATLGIEQARTLFAGLAPADRAAVGHAALAMRWVALLPAEQQRAQVLAMATADKSPYVAALMSFMVSRGGAPADAGQALAGFAALPREQQLLFTNQVLVAELRSAGRKASTLGGAERDAAYARGYDALATVFPDSGNAGSLKMGSSQLRTFQGSDITVLAPRGGVNVGELVVTPNGKTASDLGIVTAAGGAVSVVVQDSVAVNQSRVFTVGKGDLLMWASEGDLDAGRGAKTVTGAPPPLYRIDASGHFVADTSGSFSGSGIAVLDASSTLDLYAPKGEINAGDAGIKSAGNAFFGAVRFVGADNLQVGGVAVGAPPPAPTGGATAGLASAGAAATSAGNRGADNDDEEERRKRRARRNLMLEFLGFGSDR